MPLLVCVCVLRICVLLVALLSMQSRVINVNAFGDDYVSFVPMHLSFSPDGRCILVSTGELGIGLCKSEEVG